MQTRDIVAHREIETNDQTQIVNPSSHFKYANRASSILPNSNVLHPLIGDE